MRFRKFENMKGWKGILSRLLSLDIREELARWNYLQVMHGGWKERSQEGRWQGEFPTREELGVNEAPAVYVTHVVASERVKYEGSVTYHPLPTYPPWRRASSAVSVSIVINVYRHPPPVNIRGTSVSIYLRPNLRENTAKIIIRPNRDLSEGSLMISNCRTLNP